MLWTLVFCIQAAFAVDQGLLDSFKTMKEKFLQAQDALGQFETLLHRETGVKSNVESKEDNNEESTGLGKEYGILNSVDAWSRMSTWTRPETSSDQSTKAASEEVEKVDRKLPSSLRNIRIGKTTVKIYKDTKSNTMVLSVKTRTDAEFSHFQLMASVYSSYYKLLPGMCGKGFCFVAEKNGAESLLILNADLTLVSDFIELSIYLSHSDSFALRIDNIATYSNDTLLTYHLQEFQVHNEEDDQVILDPQDTQINFNTTINLGVTKDANNTFIHTYKFYEPGSHNESQYEYTGTNDDITSQDGEYQSVARYDLNPEKPMDGVINLGHQISITEDISLEVRKRYTVFPKGQEDSTYFLNNAIVGKAHEDSPLQANLPHAFYIAIFGAPTDISISKHSRTQVSYDFPGFDFLITRYAKGQVGVMLTSYNVSLEDAGIYEIMAYFEDGLSMTYSFKVHVVNSLVRIESFSKTASTNGDGNNEISIEFTCKALGNPLSSVYFINRIYNNDNSSLSAFRDIKLENNGTVEIMPTEVNEDSMSRKIILHKLPESFAYPYEMGCKASSEEQEIEEILYVYESDFEIY